MEFLVTMTTLGPERTPSDEDDGGGARAAARSRELGLNRMWRLPAGCDTIGLFTAEDRDQLDEMLAAMPGRSRRTDDVVPLGDHRDDPARVGITPKPGMGPEYLITTTVTVTPDTPAAALEEANTRESRLARELARKGHLVRLWALPDDPDGPRTVGLWRARDPGDLMALLEALPLSEWMTIETTPLRPHPDDPVRSA